MTSDHFIIVKLVVKTFLRPMMVVLWSMWLTMAQRTALENKKESLNSNMIMIRTHLGEFLMRFSMLTGWLKIRANQSEM